MGRCEALNPKCEALKGVVGYETLNLKGVSGCETPNPNGLGAPTIVGAKLVYKKKENKTSDCHR